MTSFKCILLVAALLVAASASRLELNGFTEVGYIELLRPCISCRNASLNT